MTNRVIPASQYPGQMFVRKDENNNTAEAYLIIAWREVGDGSLSPIVQKGFRALPAEIVMRVPFREGEPGWTDGNPREWTIEDRVINRNHGTVTFYHL